MLIFKKEKQVVESIKEHLGVVDDCLRKSRETLETYVTGDTSGADALAREVDELETGADTVKRQIRDTLYSGAYLPEIRSDIYRLVLQVDSVAGKAEECALFLSCRHPVIPEPFQPGFMEIYTLSVACYTELMRAMKAFIKPKGKFEKLQERSDRVGRLESQVDALQASMVRGIYAAELDPVVKLELANFLGLVAGIADVTEKAAGQLMFTALKSRI